MNQSNMIPNIHRLVISDDGENYWFSGCAKYVMECYGESDYDYSFFAGITGDIFTQHYKFGFPGDGVNSCHQHNGDVEFFERIFAKCGYSASFVRCRELCGDKDKYLKVIIDYIDKGIPVITLGNDKPLFGVFVGYEDGGKTLLYITGDNDLPQKIAYSEAMESNKPDIDGFIFVGEKKEAVPLSKIYRDAITALPELLATNNDKYCFGAAAFRKWADDIEGGIFDDITPETYDEWSMYHNFVCVFATNSGGCQVFLDRALKLNPDFGFLKEIGALYSKTGTMWEELEALGGGFNVTLKTLQDKDKRAVIASKLREFAEVTDNIAEILDKNLTDKK